MAFAFSPALQAGLLAFWAHGAAGDRSAAGAGAALLQHQRQSAVSMEAAEPGTCAELVSQGVSFRVGIEVGTPGQKLSPDVDTGSELLIIPSCACRENGSCNKRDRCFTGTNRSASFAVLLAVNGLERRMTEMLGSGEVTGTVARDKVRIGEWEADMKDGLLLMTRKDLDFGGPFEGLLGLGLPQNPSGFLAQAKIKRFAMCVNQGSYRGVLRFDQPEAPDTMKHASIGVKHWSLGFHGISIAGSEMVRLQFCSPEFMRKGQVTPCAAIVDSGNTLISGPPEHVATLLGSICDSWPRCAKNHTAMVQAAEAAKAGQPGVNSSNAEIWSKEEVLNALMADCGDWMDEYGIDPDMPDLHFHIVGGNRTKETLVLPAHYYVNEDASGKRKVCYHGLSNFTMPTSENGPVWILGMPFFYEFNIHFDISSEPPSVTFQSLKQVPCGVCDKKLGLISTGVHSAFRRPRKLSGPARRPSFKLGPVL